MASGSRLGATGGAEGQVISGSGIVPGEGGLSTRRVILLGASNVSLGFPTLVATAGRLLGAPLDLLGAFGHGRSYGMRMGILWHELPAIRDCGLWRVLEARPPAPTFALLTDVGNDILYDVPVSDIAGWVETCLERLARAGARVVMTSLPLCNLPMLSPRRFLLCRTVLFPGCRLSYDTVVGRACELDRHVRELAARYRAMLAEPQARWYGLDPIHIRREWRPQAWLDILSRWSKAAPLPATAFAPIRHSLRLRLRLMRPECQWLFGWERHTAQPVGRLMGGTSIALY